MAFLRAKTAAAAGLAAGVLGLIAFEADRGAAFAPERGAATHHDGAPLVSSAQTVAQSVRVFGEIEHHDGAPAAVFRAPGGVAAAMATGEVVEVSSGTGATMTGKVHSVAAPDGDAGFIAVVALDPEACMPLGTDVDAVIAMGEVRAHQIPATLVVSDGGGGVGVHVLDDGDQVIFLPVQLLRAGPKGLWVTGLPEVIRVVPPPSDHSPA